jgi:hypothetical protein
MAMGKVTTLVHVAAGDQPKVDDIQHLHEAAAGSLRDVAVRRRRQFGIVG